MSVFHIDFQDGVNDFDVDVNESIFFLFCMPNDASSLLGSKISSLGA